MGGPPTDPTGDKQDDCRSDASEPPMTPAPLIRHQASDAQPGGYGLLDRSPEGRSQFLSVLDILRPLLPQLGMRREIILDGLDLPFCQPPINPSM
jgi:hypothetical protein